MSNFQIVNSVRAVAFLNEMMGNKFPEGDTDAVISGIDLQISLIEEEFTNELGDISNQIADAVESGIVPTDDQFAEFLDAIGDSITVLDGLAWRINAHETEIVQETMKLVSLGGFTVRPYDPYHSLDTIEVIKLLRNSAVEVVTSTTDILRAEALRKFCYFWAFLRHDVFVKAAALGYDAEEAFVEVQESNMTKGCTAETVRDTLERYWQKYRASSPEFCIEMPGINEHDLEVVETIGGVFVVRAARNFELEPGKPVKKGKFFKSIEFSEPDFSDLDRFKLKNS